ncbi:cation diffusion facilitator family transporter [Montanilutibacter psychrotolerans]|uniref:Cation transporter n=1 Tax=Montanilutibacter psychrotolerans TaxID=1327343 RepID=A0A3M8SQB8_9GAMM|nr:cation diffusion facilitator family transporter [Lysobacter psychrotolerans]RNF81706.1 cation transporter [Lysobacter psychrotolerans]
MHSHAHHSHSHGSSAFATVTLVNLAYTLLEAGYGFATNSLALLSDALHNFGDVLGLALAWAAAVIARRAPTERHTYGWRRATLLSPLANSLLLVAFAGALGWEAVRRFNAPPEIPALPVIVVAAIGIAVNLGAAWLVRDGHVHDLNRRAAFLHLIADAAVSLAAVLAGLGMWWMGWSWLDPATAVLVGLVVAIGAFGLLRESFDAAMDAVPRSVDQSQVRDFLSGLPGVQAVHHLHIWSLGAGEIAMTAHLVRPRDAGRDAGGPDHDAFIDHINHELDHRFGINHPTLQVEHGKACEHDRHDRAPHGH